MMLQLLELIERIDVSILLFIQEHIRNSVLDRLFLPITHFADDGIFWILLAIVLMLYPKTRKAGFAAFLSMAIVYVVCSMWLKDAVARVRPYDAYSSVLLMIEKDPDFSFPSCHTTISFAAALIYARMLEQPFAAATVVLAALIGFSRLYIGIHYPSDVIGGFLLALVVSSFIYMLFRWSDHKAKR